MVTIDLNIVLGLVSAGLTVAGIVLGDRWQKVKKLLGKIVEAAQDDTVTEEEFQAIVTLAKEIAA